MLSLCSKQLVGEAMEDKEREEYRAVLDRLNDGARMEKMLHSDDWKAFNAATKYIAEKANKALKTVDPADQNAIVRLQLQAQFYEDVIPQIIQQYKAEAEEAFEAAKQQDWLGRIKETLGF